jgi:hypothetical protein
VPCPVGFELMILLLQLSKCLDYRYHT